MSKMSYIADKSAYSRQGEKLDFDKSGYLRIGAIEMKSAKLCTEDGSLERSESGANRA